MKLSDLPALLGREVVHRVTVADACKLLSIEDGSICSKMSVWYHKRCGHLPEFDLYQAWSPGVFVSGYNDWIVFNSERKRKDGNKQP